MYIHDRNKKYGYLQPDGFLDELCAAIILNSIHNKENWHDVPCAYDNIHHFMCEIKLSTNYSEGNNGYLFLV
jgi:hypothetical protein